MASRGLVVVVAVGLALVALVALSAAGVHLLRGVFPFHLFHYLRHA